MLIATSPGLLDVVPLSAAPETVVPAPAVVLLATVPPTIGISVFEAVLVPVRGASAPSLDEDKAPAFVLTPVLEAPLVPAPPAIPPP